MSPDDGVPASSEELLARYQGSVMGTYGNPQRVLVRGQGCYVWDAEGRRYLDLLAGLAVNSLGHAHPHLVNRVAAQIGTLGHVSNFFATPPQIELAERLLAAATSEAAGSDHGGRVFFANSGAEANEAAFKLARRTGRPRLLAASGGFHGRTMGALALTGKPAIAEPFLPLPAGVEHLPFGDIDALAAAVDDDVAAVVLEPIQGEAGVHPAPAGYLREARSLTRRHGCLLVLDEVQTGIGRTGSWFAFQDSQALGEDLPDVVTLAKGLGGGIPIGACIAFGTAAELLGPGHHATTFGGNPVSASAGLSVLEVIRSNDLLVHVSEVGRVLAQQIGSLGDDLVVGVRGRGLLLAIQLRHPVAAEVASAALDHGFIVNAVAADAVRLAPPLVLTVEQAQDFVAALPGVLAQARTTAGIGDVAP